MGKACEEFRELLVAEAAGELSLEDRAQVREHLATCLGCAEMAEGQRMLWKAMDAWEAPPISPNFNARLMSRVESETTGMWERWLRRWRPFLVHKGLPVAAAVALTVTLLVVGGQRTKGPSPAPGNVFEKASVAPDQAEGVLEDLETLQELNGIAPAGASEPAL
jgi:anti-sigma factor RsiW